MDTQLSQALAAEIGAAALAGDFAPAMRLALDAALEGPAGTANPQVGCVLIAADGGVLAVGHHRGAGTAHAEVDALNAAVSARGARALAGATAVVSLEPCNHTGRTGPCSEALIAAGITRVVYAVADPGVASAHGADRLREAGVEVIAGIGAAEVEQAIEPWLTSMRRGTPWVTVKWGSSLDGRAAAADGTSKWITGPASREDVHRRRADHQAILVGTGTVLADDPELTARDAAGALLPNQPAPIVVGDRQVPEDARLKSHPHPLTTLPGHDPAGWLAALGAAGIRSVFVEGGPTVASAVLAAGLADEVLVYLAPVVIGGPKTAIGDVGVATIADRIRLTTRGIERLGDDVLVIARPEIAPEIARAIASGTGTTGASTTEQHEKQEH